MLDNGYTNNLEQEVRELRAQIERIAQINEMSVELAFYSKSKAAKILGISQRTLDRWSASEYIHRTVVGGRVFFHKNEVVRVAQLYTYGISTVSQAAILNNWETPVNRRDEIQSAHLQ